MGRRIFVVDRPYPEHTHSRQHTLVDSWVAGLRILTDTNYKK